MTAYVLINFLERFRDALLGDVKVCTTRMKPMAHVGDRFRAFGAEFEVTDVRHIKLGRVAKEFWEDEGFESEDAFIEIWRQIHPKKGYDPRRWAWLHRFRRVT